MEKNKKIEKKDFAKLEHNDKKVREQLEESREALLRLSQGIKELLKKIEDELNKV